MLSQHARNPRAWWLAAAVLIAGTTADAMWQKVTAASETRTRGTGMDFASTTWHALRGLLAGHDVHTAMTRIAGMGVNWPAGEHVPATLSWQAPFAALPLWAGFFVPSRCAPEGPGSPRSGFYWPRPHSRSPCRSPWR
jgi:hypothetical protein